MKTLLAVLMLTMTVSAAGVSQPVNWRSLRDDQNNLLQFNFGYDYGATAQMSYTRTFSAIRPVALGLDFSFPMGNDLLDDFKVRLGAQVEIAEVAGFQATVRIASVFRKYHNALVNVASFGSDFGLVVGYSAPTWSAGGEFGFDKAITSRLTHSSFMKEMFPGIKDGWYVPTGGNYYYGIVAGKTLGETYDLSLRLGATRAQENDENAALPLYLQLGLGARF